MILFLNGNENIKNQRKLPLVIQFYSRGQNGEFFAIFWLIAFDTKKTKSSLENSNYSVFLIIFMWRDTVPKW